MASLSIFQWLALVGLALLYFFPAVTGFQRLHPRRTGILLVNVFLGWTVVGWIAALVWAYTGRHR